MAEILMISNDILTVTISSLGAEMLSVKKNGKEQLWDGDPAVWPMHAPVMFPVCGGLRDDKFIFEGKEYNLEKHGYARHCIFEVEDWTMSTATFLLCSDEESKEHYPFDYEFRIKYSLIDSKIKIDYDVKNLSDTEMYFSVGGHEAYACPEGIEEYSVIFDQEEVLDSHVLNGNLLEHKTINLGMNTKELPLKYEYFAVDAQVFLNMKSRKATLRNRTTGEERSVEFEGFDYFLLWTKPNGNYICMEPWCNCQDFVDADCDITHKPGMIKLAPGETCVKTHTITM